MRVLHYAPCLSAWTGSTINPHCLSFCVTASVKRLQAVLESQPVVHRLRQTALGLGPDLPWEDEPSPGNLRLSTIKILTSFSLLIPAFSLVLRPPLLSVWLQPTTRRSSTPDIAVKTRLRCTVLAPDIFGA